MSTRTTTATRTPDSAPATDGAPATKPAHEAMLAALMLATATNDGDRARALSVANILPQIPGAISALAPKVRSQVVKSVKDAAGRVDRKLWAWCVDLCFGPCAAAGPVVCGAIIYSALTGEAHPDVPAV